MHPRVYFDIQRRVGRDPTSPCGVDTGHGGVGRSWVCPPSHTSVSTLRPVWIGPKLPTLVLNT
eukprot:3713719-Rhodomonas_salina.1